MHLRHGWDVISATEISSVQVALEAGWGQELGSRGAGRACSSWSMRFSKSAVRFLAGHRRAMILPSGSPTFAGSWRIPRESGPVWLVQGMAPGLATVVSWPAPEQLNIGCRIRLAPQIMIRRASGGTSAGRDESLPGGSARAGADRRWAQAAPPGWKVLGH